MKYFLINSQYIRMKIKSLLCLIFIFFIANPLFCQMDIISIGYIQENTNNLKTSHQLGTYIFGLRVDSTFDTSSKIYLKIRNEEVQLITSNIRVGLNILRPEPVAFIPDISIDDFIKEFKICLLDKTGIQELSLNKNAFVYWTILNELTINNFFKASEFAAKLPPKN